MPVTFVTPAFVTQAIQEWTKPVWLLEAILLCLVGLPERREALRPNSRRYETEEDLFLARIANYFGAVGTTTNPDGSGKSTLKQDRGKSLVSDEEGRRWKRIIQPEFREALAQCCDLQLGDVVWGSANGTSAVLAFDSGDSAVVVTPVTLITQRASDGRHDAGMIP